MNQISPSPASKIFILWTSFTLILASEDDGLFTSSSDLESLLTTETELVKALKDYVQIEEDRIIKVKQHIQAYEDINRKAQSNVEGYIGNPLNSFLLIKRLTSDFKELKALLTPKADHVLHNFTDHYSGPLKWPSEEDLYGAALALTRLQDTYNLDATDLSHGKLNGINYGTSLSAHDCFELGRQHYNNNDHDNTVIWMKEALKRSGEEDKKTIKNADVFEYLAFSYYRHDNMKRALHYTNLLINEQPDHPRAHGNKLYYESKLEPTNDIIANAEHKKGDDGIEDNAEPEFSVQERKLVENAQNEFSIYKKLCRGEPVHVYEKRKDLKCQYTHGFDPFLLLAPYKEEELYLSPRIVLYHDVISKAETETVKSLSTPRFRRATVQNYKTGELETATYRISKTSWLKREEHDDIDKIYR